MTEQQQLPEKLYKYRSWSDPLHRRILTHNEIWFASPRWFNDPFDCKLTSTHSHLSRDQVISHYRAYFENRRRDHNFSFTEQDVESEADRLINMSKSEFEGFESKLLRKYDADTGIFTTSSINDDILMWSHYSDSHRGFCVELDLDSLRRHIQDRFASCNLAIEPYKVDYPDNYPILLRLPGLNKEGWMRQYLLKSKRWKYESEYRLINLNKTDFPYPLRQGIITKVILGCQMPDGDQEEIKHVLLKQGGGIALEKAEKRDGEFGLEFVPIDY